MIGKQIISDSDVPSGSGGINREGYTYGQLRRQPIIPEVMRSISDPTVRRWAEECKVRNHAADGHERVAGCLRDRQYARLCAA